MTASGVQPFVANTPSGPTYVHSQSRPDTPTDTGLLHLPSGECEGPRPARSSGTILLVEDEAPVRTIARRILVRQGYMVIEAANYTGDELLPRGAHASRTAFLEKPFTPDKLIDAVRRVLPGREIDKTVRVASPARVP
ncbi:MAG: hypothetical protein ABI322_11035 [Gemmatimonadaceae bacterium]